jgi:hypothetical protein
MLARIAPLVSMPGTCGMGRRSGVIPDFAALDAGKGQNPDWIVNWIVKQPAMTAPGQSRR